MLIFLSDLNGSMVCLATADYVIMTTLMMMTLNGDDDVYDGGDD